MARPWRDIKHKSKDHENWMRERAERLHGAKDNMSASSKDLASEQWRMTAEICDRLDRKDPKKGSSNPGDGWIVAMCLGAIIGAVIMAVIEMRLI